MMVLAAAVAPAVGEVGLGVNPPSEEAAAGTALKTAEVTRTAVAPKILGSARCRCMSLPSQELRERGLYP